MNIPNFNLCPPLFGIAEDMETTDDLGAKFGLPAEISGIILKKKFEMDAVIWREGHERKFFDSLEVIKNIGNMLETVKMDLHIRRINGDLYLFRAVKSANASPDEEEKLLKEWKHLFTCDKKVEGPLFMML